MGRYNCIFVIILHVTFYIFRVSVGVRTEGYETGYT